MYNKQKLILSFYSQNIQYLFCTIYKDPSNPPQGNIENCNPNSKFAFKEISGRVTVFVTNTKLIFTSMIFPKGIINTFDVDGICENKIIRIKLIKHDNFL